jgi:RHH-type proline utilization regulon transcriptional repressor/proline dehydrogenase/delta 1-pyrroline-5-carboxylate dehydrogenase
MGEHIEEKIRGKALEMKALMEGEAPSLFDAKRWSGKTLGWVTRDEVLKVALFRFIDVLPALKEDALVLRLAKEYLAGEDVAPLIKTGIRGFAP